MAPLYKPPTKVTTTQIPYLALVNQADPDFEARKHHQNQMVDYGFVSGSQHYVDPYKEGAYNGRSNVYPVGQPYGAPITPPHADSSLAETNNNNFLGSTLTADVS